MEINVHEIGNSRTKVVVIDDFLPNPERILEIADAMRPFPEERDFYYPGVRRYFEDEDTAALLYMDELIKNCIPIFRDIYGANGLSLGSIGFSVVTTPPEELKPIQCSPHFDSNNINDIAILHYLNPLEKGGTAFFRHKATGLEFISSNNRSLYRNQRELESNRPNPKKYILGSNEHFDEIARFENKFNRVLVYQGAILHSGIIEDDFQFSLEPPDWRLTTTCFVRLE